MILYNCKTTTFTIYPSSAKESVEINATWVGTSGVMSRQIIVPVIGEYPVDDLAWGVVPSRTMRPKIVANRDRRWGIIARLCGYSDKRSKYGRIYIHNDFYRHRQDVCVLAHGIGVYEATGAIWDEIIIRIIEPTIPIRFIVSSVPDDLYYEIMPDTLAVSIASYGNYEIDKDFVKINESCVPFWKRSIVQEKLNE